MIGITDFDKVGVKVPRWSFYSVAENKNILGADSTHETYTAVEKRRQGVLNTDH